MLGFEAQIELKQLVLVLELINIIFKDNLAKKTWLYKTWAIPGIVYIRTYGGVTSWF